MISKIGVGEPECRDEYKEYVPVILRLGGLQIRLNREIIPLN